MNKNFSVRFVYENFGAMERLIGMRSWIENEFVEVYNKYAEICNNGLTDTLNSAFKSEHPNYFIENSDKEWPELIEYNTFMATWYNLIAENLSEKANFINFYVDPKDVELKGRLKNNPNAKIYFRLE